MRALLQRVSRARVTVGQECTGSIDRGVLVFLGVSKGDRDEEAEYLARRTASMRMFEDGEGRMNLNTAEAGGAFLVVSQFTLCADLKKGTRPSFARAAPPEEANRLYQVFLACLRDSGIQVEEGHFQAHMDVELVNDGPVTLLLERTP